MNHHSTKPSIVIEEANVVDDNQQATPSHAPTGHARNPSLLVPTTSHHVRRSSLEVPNSPSSDDGSSVPPSPTLTNSSVHFDTSLSLRDNKPEATNGLSSLDMLKPGESGHGRKGSVSSTGESTVNGHEDAADSPTRALSQPQSRSAPSEATTAVSDSESPSKDKKKNKKKKKKDVEEEEEELTGHRAELQQDENFDPAPFRYKPFELAHMLDPKSFDTLRAFGGTAGLLSGLGTSKERGLSKAGDGRPGAGDGTSHRHDTEKPAITLTEPGGDVHSTHAPSDAGNDAAAAAATIEDRRRVYGENVLPIRPSKSLLQLMWAALKDKVLVRPFVF